MTEGEVHEVNIVLKVDVQGSVEAIPTLLKLRFTDEAKVKINHRFWRRWYQYRNRRDPAAASNAILVGFNVRADALWRVKRSNPKSPIRATTRHL